MNKTKITNVKEGFDFVGFNFRVYPYKKGPGGYIFLIKPAKSSLKKVKSNLKDIIKKGQNRTAFELIEQLNPVLMGWANYYNKVVSSKAYRQVGHYTWEQLWKWAKKKNPKLTYKEAAKMYFRKVANRKWIFFGEKEGRMKYLYQITDTRIARHRLVLNKNPYLPEHQDYFTKKDNTITSKDVWGNKKLSILKKTGFKCKVCGLVLHPTQDTQVHHILPKSKGGTDAFKNLLVLHTECHKQVTFTKNPGLKAGFKHQGILKDVEDALISFIGNLNAPSEFKENLFMPMFADCMLFKHHLLNTEVQVFRETCLSRVR